MRSHSIAILQRDLFILASRITRIQPTSSPRYFWTPYYLNAHWLRQYCSIPYLDGQKLTAFDSHIQALLRHSTPLSHAGLPGHPLIVVTLEQSKCLLIVYYAFQETCLLMQDAELQPNDHQRDRDTEHGSWCIRHDRHTQAQTTASQASIIRADSPGKHLLSTTILPPLTSGQLEPIILRHYPIIDYFLFSARRASNISTSDLVGSGSDRTSFLEQMFILGQGVAWSFPFSILEFWYKAIKKVFLRRLGRQKMDGQSMRKHTAGRTLVATSIG